LEPGLATHTERSVRVRILPDSSRAWAPTAGSFRFPSQRRNSWRGLARHCKFNADHKREDTVSWVKHTSRSHRLSSACAHQSCMNTIGVASVTRRRTCPRHEVANECVQVSPSSIAIIVILWSDWSMIGLLARVWRADWYLGRVWRLHLACVCLVDAHLASRPAFGRKLRRGD